MQTEPSPKPESIKVAIIETRENDWEKYKLIRLESLRQDPSAFGKSFVEESNRADEDWKEQFRKNAALKHERKLLLAQQNSSPIGCVGGFKRPDGVWTLNAVYVTPVFRGKGISRQLIQAVLDAIRTDSSANTVELMVNTQQIAAVKLYESFGFKIIKTLPHQKMGDGNIYEEFVMQKELKTPENESH